MLDIKTTEKLLYDYDMQVGNYPYPLTNKRWVSVESDIEWLKYILKGCVDCTTIKQIEERIKQLKEET